MIEFHVFGKGDLLEEYGGVMFPGQRREEFSLSGIFKLHLSEDMAQYVAEHMTYAAYNYEEEEYYTTTIFKIKTTLPDNFVENVATFVRLPGDFFENLAAETQKQWKLQSENFKEKPVFIDGLEYFYALWTEDQELDYFVEVNNNNQETK